MYKAVTAARKRESSCKAARNIEFCKAVPAARKRMRRALVKRYTTSMQVVRARTIGAGKRE